MDLHLVLFHPEEKKVEEDCTLEEKVEGGQQEEEEEKDGKVEKKGADDVCQLCDLPLPPPLSLADHLLAEHDVSILLLFWEETENVFR